MQIRNQSIYHLLFCQQINQYLTYQLADYKKYKTQYPINQIVKSKIIPINDPNGTKINNNEKSDSPFFVFAKLFNLKSSGLQAKD